MPASAAARLDEMMAEYEPAIAAQARAALATLRKRVRGATEMVYDNYNALVIGFVPTTRPSDVVLSIALYPKWVTMFFMHGARLPDPAKRLEGSGKQVRGIRLVDGAKTLDEPAVRALIAAALADAKVGFDAKQPRTLVIQAVSPTRRPRRPAASTTSARPSRRPAAAR